MTTSRIIIATYGGCLNILFQPSTKTKTDYYRVQIQVPVILISISNLVLSPMIKV